MSVDKHWQTRLDELARGHRVPGAALAIWQDGQLFEAATGVLNVDTGVETTTDSLFQIGSVTKSYTATLIMQLVADGRLDLDDPVAKLLPDLRLGDQEETERVTMRHLLAHTSGIQGDYFEDFGRGDDVVRKYVDGCADLGFVHSVGATMSYCNTGYVIAGRVIEVLTDLSWDQALRERLIKPLGLEQTVTLPEEALRFRVAHGHVVKAGERPHLAPVWTLPRSLGPAGLICATAADMVTFGRMHLDAGRSRAGSAVLDEHQVGAMQAEQVELPDTWVLGRYWGLGWILFDWDGQRVYGHDGGTIGQTAFLRVVPGSGAVVGLFANGGRARELYFDLFSELMSELCDLRMPPPLEPPAQPASVPTETHAGRYESVGLRIELEDVDGTLRGRVTDTSLSAIEDDPVDEITLVPVSDGLFVTRDDGERLWTPMVFYRLQDGSAYLHMAGRATPKIE